MARGRAAAAALAAAALAAAALSPHTPVDRGPRGGQGSQMLPPPAPQTHPPPGKPKTPKPRQGLPVIATNWSGITAFLDERVGYPLDVESLVDIRDDSFWWFKARAIPLRWGLF